MTDTVPAILLAGLAVGTLVSLGLFVWYLWALARLFPHLGLPAAQGWVPVANVWRLLERAGLPGWLVLLAFVGLGIVPYVALVLAAHRLNAEAGSGTGMTVLAALIPPLWAMMLADDLEAHPPRAPAPPPLPPEQQHVHVSSEWAPLDGSIAAPAPPPAWNPVAAPPPAPAGSREQFPVSAPVPPPPAHPAARPLAPAPPPSPFAASSSPFAGPVTAPASQEPFPDPFPVSLPGEDEEDDHTIVNAPAEEEDHTIVVDDEPRNEWLLEIDGAEYELAPDTTVGRTPVAAGGSTVLTIHDPSRVLSKSHARFRLSGETWTVEDLGSTNGTTLLHPGGRGERVEPHTQATVASRFLLGTLLARIRRRDDDDGQEA